MKNYQKITTVVALMFIAAACSVKSTSSKTTSTSSGTSASTSTSTTTTTTSTNVTDNGTVDCPVIVEGKCYRRVSGIIASGGTYGQTWWSSTNYVSSTGTSPNYFSTDAVFKVRIVPHAPTANATSTFGKVCSPYRMYATKAQIQLMLHKQGVSVGEVATLASALNTASSVWSFTVPATSSPLVLEVINVQTDSRCTGNYGSNPTSCSTSPYLDIPINNAGPTECINYDILYATDDVWSVQ